MKSTCRASATHPVRAVTYYPSSFITPPATATAFPPIVECWRAGAVSGGGVGVDVDLSVVMCGGDGVIVLAGMR